MTTSLHKQKKSKTTNTLTTRSSRRVFLQKAGLLLKSLLTAKTSRSPLNTHKNKQANKQTKTPAIVAQEMSSSKKKYPQNKHNCKHYYY